MRTDFPIRIALTFPRVKLTLAWMKVLRATAAPLFAAAVASAATPSFNPGVQTGTLANSTVTEASGLAVSHRNPGVLWTHNDSGNPAELFALTASGANLGTYALTGTTNVDWEDLSIGPGPAAGTQYLYVADTGDNDSNRSSVAIYRVPEPAVSVSQAAVNTSLAGASKLMFTYPDGAHDAESMFVDPATRDLYVITKRDTPNKRVYRAAYPQSTSGSTVLEYVTQFASTTLFTSADISPNGTEILIRGTDATTGRLFQRPLGGTIAAAFNTTPVTIPLANEAQGEAIAFDINGAGYYTTSEGANAPIYYFSRVPEPAGVVVLSLASLLMRRRSASI